ncbi:MAG TPA: hemerythrin domain-containing protein [Acidimicrobiia bacterium]|nr:hemerythrin domain-containing protein [Acidimicrobiia bacterium]
MPDGYETLQQDHREVERLFEKYRSAKDDAIAREICAALTLHTEVEEQVVYPLLREQVPNGATLSVRATDEHGLVSSHIARVYEAPPPDLGGIMRDIERDVQVHVAFEEQELFPAMRRAGVDAGELHDRVEAAKGEAPSRSSGQVG